MHQLRFAPGCDFGEAQVLIDPLQAVGVGTGDNAASQLIEDLRQASRVYSGLDQVLLRDAASRFRDTIAEAVVDDADRAVVHRL